MDFICLNHGLRGLKGLRGLNFPITHNFHKKNPVIPKSPESWFRQIRNPLNLKKSSQSVVQTKKLSHH
jgi:hypothetical protein